MTDDLLSLAHDVLARARKLGADSGDALAIDSQGTDIEMREGEIEKLERTESRGVGLRVFIGQSSAMISASVFTPLSLNRLAETAVAMARATPPDPFAGIAARELLATDFPKLDLVSAYLPDSEKLKTLSLDVEGAALAVQGVSKSGGAGASASQLEIALVTSAGFAQSYQRTGISLSVSAIAGEGTGMERDYDYTAASHFEDLKSAAEVGKNAGERAVKRLSPRKIASQSVPVIYDRRVSSSLLGHLSSAINGAAIARGTSFLKNEMGQQILAKGIFLIDDPLRQRGMASRPFDAEGLPSRKRELVADGILNGWVLDLRAARQLGLPPAGNGSRGLSSPPGPSTSNLHLEPGTLSPEQMTGSIQQGLYITELIGSSVNLVTGDYSRGASGFWIEQGQLAFPVSEITIAGNLRDMFLTLAPANDLIFKSSTNAPSCRVDGLTIAGT
ncbi:MAG: TldD/PmbA family protein [Aestuariivirga sp.]|jgi:PmbA protein